MSLKVASDPAYPSVDMSEPIPNINLAEEQSVTITADMQSETDKGKQQLLNPEKQMQSEIDKANSHLRFRGTRCEFKFYDDINRVAIKILDNETNEVVQEIPPEETMELIQKLWEFAGLLYDKKG